MMLNYFSRIRVFFQKQVYSTILQTVLLIIYFGVIPLIYSYEAREFYLYKLIILYSSITLLFIVTLISFHSIKGDYYFLIKIYQIEYRLIIMAILLLITSQIINYEYLHNLFSNEFFSREKYFGLGPNYLVYYFYIFSFVFVGTAIVIMKGLNSKLIGQVVVFSLVLVGIVIIYQIFVNDFLKIGENFLFGWGNSNSTPDAFAIVGLMLLIPSLYKQKINYLHIILGILFFEIILLSQSRAAYVGTLVSLLITAIILIKMKKSNSIKVAIFFACLFILVIVSYLLFEKEGFVESTGSILDSGALISRLEFNSLSRRDIWYGSLMLFARTPITILFGIGQGVFFWNTEESITLITNVHNQYLEILLSGGIILFSVFISLLVKQFIYVFKLIKYNVDNVVLLSALIFICIKWLFNSLNATHSPFIFMVFVLISYRYLEMKRNEKVNQS